MLKRHALWCFLIVVFVKQVIFVFTTPPWLVPDEAAHIQYARTLWLEGRIPELRGRLIVYDDTMNALFRRSDIRQIGFEGRKKFELEQYWTAHPNERSTSARYNPAGTYSPIYYSLVGWPIPLMQSSPASTQIFALRLISSTLLLVVVAMAWKIVQRLSQNTGLAATVALLVGFHPGLSINFAGVNNDAGLIAGGSIILAILSGWWHTRPSWRSVVGLGLGLGLLTLLKPVGASTVIMAAVAILAIFGWRTGGAWHRAVVIGLLGAGLGSLWMIRERYLGYSSFLTDASLWEIQSRLLSEISFGAILHGDFTYWWPAAFFTTWGEYFAKLKIPTVLPIGYFAVIAILFVAAIIGWLKALAVKKLSPVEHRILVISLLGVIIHETWLWLVHLQTILRYHDFHFLYHGRYRYVVTPLVLLLLVLGLEKLFLGKEHHIIRGTLVMLMVSACIYVGWTAAHV